MKRLKVYFSVVAMFVAVTQNQAQTTGVNTKNPKGSLHVDAGKNNDPSGSPTTAQETDDFIVTFDGKVGIGTITPTHKLDIRGKIQIRDGGEKVGAVLTAVDNTGLAVWNLPSTVKSMVNGTFPTGSTLDILPDGSTDPKNSGISITLSRGKWLVNAGITFISGNATIYQRCYLSSSNTTILQNGFNFLGPGGAQTCYGGILFNSLKNGPITLPEPYNNMQLGFVTGSAFIEVLDPDITLYLLLQNQPIGAYHFNKSYLENYFYARPVD